jgi:Alpha/beta hydrolase family
MSWQTIRKWWARLGSAAFVIFIAWGLIAYEDWGVDPSVLTTGGNVEVRATETEIRFLPRNARSVGLIFFPGALVDPDAYAPMLRKVAEAGYPAFLVKLPLRGYSTETAAAEARTRAGAIFAEQTAVRRWIVGGHSKGGLFACRVAAANVDLTGRLLLIGTAHPRHDDLSKSGIAVTKIVGTRDGQAGPNRVRASAHLLPATTRWVWIEGANHSQFARYGFPFGDKFATLSRAEQEARVFQEILAELAQIESQAAP